ncbi:MAG: hypothetical protein JXQ76_12590, partial [Campylobacterales bacterium]|nr:hypothetical protein [Campylobacterales bacterium]
MILELQNIGMIKEAKVNIDGLTVIAGENDTGKSTVGKTLYYAIRNEIQKSKTNLSISSSSNSQNNVQIVNILLGAGLGYLLSNEKGNNTNKIIMSLAGAFLGGLAGAAIEKTANKGLE